MIDWDAALVEHGPWLRSVVLGRVREPQAVEEVMQEVALAVVQKPPALADAAKVAPWLYRVAVTQSIRYRRTQARRRRGLAGYAERCGRNGDGREPTDPLRLLLAEERRKLVAQALQRLPGRDAEILLLKYSERWSYRQLSERLGMSSRARRPTVDGCDRSPRICPSTSRDNWSNVATNSSNAGGFWKCNSKTDGAR